MNINVLDFSSVSYQLGNIRLLSDASFVVKKNTIHAILGPNGAGKSTILKLVLGLIKSTSGQIRISNSDISDRQNLRHIGSLIETVSLYLHLNVFENLLVASLERGVERSSLLETLNVVGLSDQRHKKAKDLSMGMKQRLGIAMAIIHKPKILLLDEPTNGLDPEGVVAIRKLLMKLIASQNVTILLTSHILNEVDKIADDITLIQNGRITYTGNIKEFKGSSNIEEEYLNRAK
jgi:ABC-type multidrug transport system ATPase subunit